MRRFDISETVICSATIRRAGTLTVPTSIVISIYLPNGNLDVTDAAMTPLAGETGKYFYDYATTGKATGNYRARIKAVYGGRTTLKDGSFKLQ